MQYVAEMDEHLKYNFDKEFLYRKKLNALKEGKESAFYTIKLENELFKKLIAEHDLQLKSQHNQLEIAQDIISNLVTRIELLESAYRQLKAVSSYQDIVSVSLLKK
jgi:predicted small metal-binding protein